MIRLLIFNWGRLVNFLCLGSLKLKAQLLSGASHIVHHAKLVQWGLGKTGRWVPDSRAGTKSMLPWEVTPQCCSEFFLREAGNLNSYVKSLCFQIKSSKKN